MADVIRIHPWEPGEVSTEDTEILGGYDEDTVLVGILRDPHGDAGSGNLKCDLKVASDSGERFYFRSVKSDSILFKGDLAGGRVEIRIPVPRHTKLAFHVAASAATTVRWLFLFAPAWADRQAVDSLVSALSRPEK